MQPNFSQDNLPFTEELPAQELPEIIFLRENQWSEFYQSLLTQYETKGFLSDKQKSCVYNAMDKKAAKEAMPKIVPDTKVQEFSLKTGQIIEVKSWIAKKLKEQLKLDFFLRNLETVEVQNETSKAYCVSFRFVSKPVASCHVCGKALDNEISIITGIGPSCAKKLGLPRPSIKEANLTLIALEGICSKTGIIGPVWIPKNQVKHIKEA